VSRPATVRLLTPAAAAWLATPLREATRVVVVGVAGGVGTTTVAELLRWAFATYRDGPAATGRGGAAAASLGGAGHPRAAELTVHDLGPNAATLHSGISSDDGARVLVVVCGAHRHGLAAAREAAGERPAVVVPVAVAGRAEPGPRLVAHAAGFAWDAAVVPLGRSRALAAGGALPTPALAPGPYRSGIAIAVEVIRRA